MKKYILVLLFVISCFLHSNAQWVINTIAGDGTPGYSGDGGLATTAQLAAPAGIVTDDSGNVYIADYRNNAIRKVTASTGIITTIAGNGTPGASGDSGLGVNAKLDLPTYLALDSHKNILYIADYGNNRIRKLDLKSNIITAFAGTGIGNYSGDNGPALLADFNQPFGIAISNSGDMYVSDGADEHIRKINMLTDTITTIAGNGQKGYSGDSGQAISAKFNYPTGLTFDLHNNLYVADFNNNCIRKINLNTGIITTFAGTSIQGFSGDGKLAIHAEMNRPIDVKADTSGNIYIADSRNNRIRMVNASTGIITTIAGNGTPGYTGDGGTPANATLNYPDGLAFDTLGNIYISDANNSVVREISESTAGIKNMENLYYVNVYPNPGSGRFVLSCHSESGVADEESDVILNVYNVLGQPILTKTLRSAQGDNTIDLSSQPAGVYLYRVISETGSLIGQGKLVVEK